MLGRLRSGRVNLLHEPPLSLKVFGDIVVSGWQDFFDCDINPKVGPCR